MKSTAVCPEWEPLLGPYAEAELPPLDAGCVAEHVRDCPACQQRLRQLETLRRLIASDPQPAAPPALRSHFLALLAAEKVAQPTHEKTAGPFLVRWLRPGWSRVAASLALVALGALLTLWLRPQTPSRIAHRGISHLGLQLAMAPASPTTAGDRLGLIRQVPRQAQPGDPLVQVLITTLNADPNPNVRLAAAEALYRLRADPTVPPALMQALPNQTDPNVQITLIELLVALRDPGAAGRLRDFTRRPDVLPVVRQQAQNGLSQLL